MKKVLMITEAYGGGIKTHFDLINRYKNKFPDTDILFCISEKRLEANQSNSLENCIVNNNLSNFRRLSSWIENLKQLNTIVDENQIEIIHSHSTIAGLLCKIYSILFRNKKNIKFVYTPHGYYSQGQHFYFKKRIIVIIEKLIEKRKKTIHVSRGENIHSTLNKISDSSTIIFNGTEIPDVKHSQTNNERTSIGYLARAEEPKNVERFVRIADSFLSKYSEKNVRFVFGGKGKDFFQIEEKVNKMKQSEKILLMGAVGKEDFFKEIDIYMSTSKYEGLPFSVIEAMSYKKPLFLSEINGHLDFKQSEATQLFKLSESDSDISEQINEFIFNEKISQYKDDIYDEFLKKFSVTDMITKINKLYNSL